MEYYKFIRKNQEGADCQLVTALNASIYVHKKRIVAPKSKKYKELIKLTGCIAGPCISIEKSWEVLKIKVNKEYKYFSDINFDDLPLEMKTWDSHYGSHSVLIIDYVHWCDAMHILNFDVHTTRIGWIFEENLELYVPRDYHRSDDTWLARSFVKV